jgi:CubicO group peptidase (beta-lactamase class C family)
MTLLTGNLMRRMSPVLLLPLVLAAAVPAFAQVATTTPSFDGRAGVARIDKARIDAALGRFVDAGKIVGASALVYQDDREAYVGTFGMADREAGRPMARDTIVLIYSMTKPLTGVALMQLHEQGKFQLDDPVARYLPEFANQRVYAGENADGKPRLAPLQRPVTIRDLLRHTSGMLDDGDPRGPVHALYRQVESYDPRNTLAEQVRILASVPLVYQPGTRWLYSPGVEVQARLVEVLSGQSFETYLHRHVLDPLRMHDTRYAPRAADRGRMAAMYQRDDDGKLSRVADADVLRIDIEKPLRPGSWGLVSTLDDYMRFARMLLGGGELDGVRLLQPATVRLMASDALPAGLTDTSWLRGNQQVGFGIDFAVRIAPPASPKEASGEIGEFFWGGMANTLFWVDPVNRIAAVLFTQYLPPGSSPLDKAFRDAVYADDTSAAAPRE